MKNKTNPAQYDMAKHFDHPVTNAFLHIGNYRVVEMAKTYRNEVYKATGGFDLLPFARNMEIADQDVKGICKRIILNAIDETSHIKLNENK